MAFLLLHHHAAGRALCCWWKPDRIGGGLRSSELIMPGLHDVCSAIHPLAMASPFFKSLPLEQLGLKFIHPIIPAAHPFDDGKAAAICSSLEETAASFDKDEQSYLRLMSPIVSMWPALVTDLLAPLHIPRHPLDMARFGIKGITSAMNLAKRFHTKEARGLWAGMAAHSVQPLTNATTSAVALVLLMAAHSGGWPIARRGSASIANVLGSYFTSIGGTIQTDLYVRSLSELPSSRAILFDVTPKQLLQIAGKSFLLL
jgi:phytoene dehydrogenase-like protein